MVEAGVIRVEDREAWRDCLRELPHSFHHTWEHAYALQRTTRYPTLLFHARDRGDRLVCPIVEREFGGHRDIATPSGIAGLLSTGDWSRLEPHWTAFVRKRGYVCGYLGLHPLFEPAGLPGDVRQHNSLYFLDLTLGADALLQQADQNRRRQLRGWEERAEAFVQDRDAIGEFLAVNYEPFMRRAGARDPHLAPETLEILAHADSAVVVGAAGDSGVEAAAVFGATPHAGDFLINVAVPDGRRHATDLVWYGAVALIERGVPVLNLGGGAREDDEVARAKQRWRAERRPLRALRQIYRPDVYEELSQAAGVDPSDEGYFPRYRSPSARLASGSAT